MGLDNFWQEAPEDDAKGVSLEFDPPLQLCGGMFSGHGSGSFRGNVYKGFIQDATDAEYSLYDVLSPEQVADIATILEACTLDPADYLIEEEEVEDLIRMFKAYAEAECYLVPWY